jgi:hypothetical protein
MMPCVPTDAFPNTMSVRSSEAACGYLLRSFMASYQMLLFLSDPSMFKL